MIVILIFFLIRIILIFFKIFLMYINFFYS